MREDEGLMVYLKPAAWVLVAYILTLGLIWLLV